jgi:hypothetical protein
VNWKEGFVVDDTTGERWSLNAEELESLRKERNRMHAKMTRDRKKELISGLERVRGKQHPLTTCVSHVKLLPLFHVYALF